VVLSGEACELFIYDVNVKERVVVPKKILLGRLNREFLLFSYEK
jgi:hypothetical protein